MNSPKKITALVVICIFFTVPASLADTIVFKSGKELKVKKIWLEDEQICFSFHGVKASIPPSKIIRIESTSNKRKKFYEIKNKTKPYSATAVQGHSGGPNEMALSSSAGAVISSETCPPLRKDGFCELRWGHKVSHVDGMIRKKTVSNFDGVIEYIRSKDISKVGDAQLRSITYAFYRDKLYTVTIWTKGYANYTALRDKVFKQFGPGHRSDSTRERYLWSDALSDIMLEYMEEGRFGMLWLRSKKLDRECRSSQLKGHASYLKWLKSRR